MLMIEHRSEDFQENSPLQVEETNYDHRPRELNTSEVRGFLLFGFLRLFFKRSFRFTTELRRIYRDFPNALCPHVCIAFPIINVSHQNGAFFFFLTKDEPAWTHRNHPKSIVYLRVHVWCFTFYRYGQMYNGLYLSS